MTERQTVASAHQKIADHEELCAERYRNIHNVLAELKTGADGSKRTLDKAVWLVITTLLAMVGWMGVQMWDGVKPTPPSYPAVSE